MANTDGGHIWLPRDADPRIIELLDGSGVTRTRDIGTDVREALAIRLGLSAAQANAHAIDDLWRRFLIAEGLLDTREPFSPDFAGGTVDDDFASVSFLSGFEGADETTTIVDEGPIGITPITANVGAELDTAIKKFGGSALLLTAADSVTVADDAALSFAAGDLTIEAHVYYNGDPGTNPRTICTKWTESGNQREWWLQSQDNVLQFYVSTTGINFILKNSAPFNPVTGQWYHIAVCRTGGLVTFWVDGVSTGNAASTETIFTGTSPMTIGGAVGGFPNRHVGNIDELRITKGLARYTEAFTAPTEAYGRTGP